MLFSAKLIVTSPLQGNIIYEKMKRLVEEELMQPKPPFKAFYRNGSVRQEGFRVNTDFLIDGGIWRILKGSFESTRDGTQIRMVFTYPNYFYFPLWLLFLTVSIYFLFRHIEKASWPVDYNQWVFLIVTCGATVLMPLDCRRRNQRFA